MSLKMTPEEKIYLDELVGISGEDISTVRNVLRSILIMFSMEAYGREEGVIIPYIGKFKFDFIDKTVHDKGTCTCVNLRTEPCISLVEELSAINEGNKPPSIKFLKKNTITPIAKIIEIKEDEEL